MGKRGYAADTRSLRNKPSREPGITGDLLAITIGRVEVNIKP